MKPTVLAIPFSLLFLSFQSPGAQSVRADLPGNQVITGCLELSPTGEFVVRSSAEHIVLHRAGGMDKHLGRTVRVTGRWQSPDGEPRLRVAKIEWIAEGCV